VLEQVGPAFLEVFVGIHPAITLLGDLLERVKVQLADERLKPGVAEVFGEDF
jgi:hypothetical protein